MQHWMAVNNDILASKMAYRLHLVHPPGIDCCALCIFLQSPGRWDLWQWIAASRLPDHLNRPSRRVCAHTAIWLKQTKDFSHKLYEFLVKIPWVSSIKQIDLYIDFPFLLTFANLLFLICSTSLSFNFLLSPLLDNRCDLKLSKNSTKLALNSNEKTFK